MFLEYLEAIAIIIMAGFFLIPITVAAFCTFGRLWMIGIEEFLSWVRKMRKQ